MLWNKEFMSCDQFLVQQVALGVSAKECYYDHVIYVSAILEKISNQS